MVILLWNRAANLSMASRQVTLTVHVINNENDHNEDWGEEGSFEVIEGQTIDQTGR